MCGCNFIIIYFQYVINSYLTKSSIATVKLTMVSGLRVQGLDRFRVAIQLGVSHTGVEG